MHEYFGVYIAFCSFLCSIEKECPDLDQVNQKLTELKSQFQKARDCAKKLPGSQYSKEEQLCHVDILHKQMELKSNLLKKYKQTSFLENIN